MQSLRIGGKVMDKNNQAVQIALDKMYGKLRPFGDLFYGDEQKGLTCQPIPQFAGIHPLEELFAVLEQCWDQETAYPSCQEEWVPEDPSFGQCAITAMLVHDMFGGTIHKIRGDGGGTHYFNRLNGKYVDLTREQFDLYNLPVAYEPNQEIPREFCGRNKNTLMRYHRLQWSIMLYLGTAILQK